MDLRFSSFDTLNTTVLGTNSKGNVNFIKTKFGKGEFLLSTVPLAFTNYNLLYGGNKEYIENALSYLPIADVIWDEYYKVGRLESNNPLRFILGTKALKWAYFTMLIFAILFIIFKGKRTQRIIPIIPPLKNTTVEFVDTVGRLYYQKGDHKDLAMKRIMYFMEHLRSKYHVNTNEIDVDFFHYLSNKTGIEQKEIERIFKFLNWIKEKPLVNEMELHKCNELIELFYTKTKI